jgi:hypothetical protein
MDFHDAPCSAEPPPRFTMSSLISHYLPLVLAAIASGLIRIQAAVSAAPTGRTLAVLADCGQ